MLRLAAVVERPALEKPPEWPAISRSTETWIQLHEASTPDETAAVVWQLASYNRVWGEAPTWPRMEMAEWVHAIVADDALVLPGGLGVFDSDGRSILPSCCAGLESWREWCAFADGGDSPWMGHDPWPGLVKSGETVRVWSDLGVGVSEPPSSSFALEIPVVDFRARLADVERDLRAFLGVLHRWTDATAPGKGKLLADRFDLAFEVSTGGS